MCKRIFAMLLALALVLSMAPATVLAEAAVTASPKAGTHTAAGHSDDCGLTEGWLPWEKTDSLPLSGQYYLTANVTMTGEVTLTGDLTLCLNGFVITSTAGKRLIGTKEGSGLTFTVTDCTACTEDGVYQAGALTGGTDNSTGGGGAVFVRRGTTMKLYDGRIVNNTSVTAGGAIALQASNSSYVGAAFYMYDGQVSDNTAISGTKYKTGGAFYMGAGCVFEMNGGTVSGNAGSGGGMLYATGTNSVKIENATITGNTASYTGAVLHCANTTTVTIRDSQLTGNICTNTSAGGTIRMDGANGKVTLSGCVVIADNTLAAGIGDIMLMNTANNKLNVQQLAAGSRVRFCAPNTTPTAAGDLIAVSESQTDWSEGWVTFVTKDGAEQVIGYDGTAFSFPAGHTHGTQQFQFWTKADSLPSEGSWCLTNDVTVSKELTITGTLELCLNGHTVKGWQGRAYIVNGTLKLYNCGETGGFTGFNHSGHGGVIYGGGNISAENIHFYNNTSTSNYGGAILTTGGTLSLTGCQFTQNAATQGGAVSIGGEATITGCSFAENTASATIGAIRVAGSKTILIDSSTFTGNSAKTVSAIGVSSVGATLTIRDTTISGNSNQSGYGAVNMIGTAKAVKLAGQVTVTGNTGGNLHVQNGAVEGYDITGLTGGQLGISLEPARITAGKLTFTTPATTNNKDFFTSDDDTYQITLNADNKLQLSLKPDHKHESDGSEYMAWNSADSLPAEGNWYLTQDVTVSAEVAVSGSLTLCLNGHTVTGGNSRAYLVSGSLQLCNCGESGGFTGFSHGNHGGVIYSSGTLVAENIAFTGNTTTNYGGVLLTTGPATLTNCVFADNTAAEGGALSLAGQAAVTGCSFTGNSATSAGAIRAAGSQAILVENCTFTGNTAKGTSAIAAISNNVTLTLKDLTITGNTATNGYGAVNVIGTAKAVTLQGKMVVTGNIGGNLHVQNGAVAGYDVSGLTEGASLGISLEPARITAGKLTFTTASDANNASYFVSDDEAYEIRLTEDKVLALKKPDPISTHKHCLCSAENTHCSHETVEFFDWTDETSMPTEGAWCLTTDVTVPKTFGVTKELTLCLNGHTVTVAPEAGRLYYVSTGGKITITDCTETAGTITGATNTAILFNGSGTDMALNLWNGSFTGNHIVGGGGAIAIQGQCSFNMYGGSITGNSATSQLKLDGEGQPLLDEQGNQTYFAANGGALFINTGSVFNMYGGEISGNKATHVEYRKAGATAVTKVGGGGGALAVYGTANLYGGKICKNEAFLGGGLLVSGEKGRLNLLGGEISGNQASASAGGVLCQSKAQTLMESGSVSGNSAALYAGGLYFASGAKFTLTGGSVSGNSAQNDGGGIYLQQATAAVKGGAVSDNRTAKLGGGICMAGENAALTISGGELRGNQALGGGGLMALSKSAVTLTGGTVHKNRTESAGAGLYIAAKCTLNMQGGKVQNNTATGYGGGIYVLRGTATFTGGSVSGNTGSTGGGIATHGGKLILKSISITGNQAVGKLTTGSDGKQTQSPGYGGGVMAAQGGYTENGVQLSAPGVVEVYDAYIADNYALSAAGGIQIMSAGSQLRMYGGTVTGNKAGSAGGGIYLSTNTDGVITGGTVTKNHAKNGGGIYFLNCEAQVSGITLSENTADATGAGGVITGKTTAVTLKDLQIRDNVAQSSGGAFMVQSYATMYLENAKLTGNAAESGGAFYFAVPTYGTMKNVEFAENKANGAGGVIYLSSNVIVTLENCTLRDNQAGGSGGAVYNKGRVELKDCKVLNNASGKNGGAIGSGKVASALLEDEAGIFAENTVFTGNSAAEQAGAVYNNRGCPVYLTDCILTENSAGTEGGAIWSDGRLGLTNVTVTGNKAESYAIVLLDSLFDGHSYFTGHKWIAGEIIVKDNEGGDLYLMEGAVMAVTGETLGENTHVDVTLQAGLLGQAVFGVYGYEGAAPRYVITAGDRSITDPEVVAQPEEVPEETVAPEAPVQETDNTILYVAIGAVAAVILLAAVLVIVKKKHKN